MTESLHALSGAYVVDALDDDERELFEKHLPGCRDCQAEVASLREAAALMADESALTPPPSLRASVLSGIKTVRPLPPETADAATSPESPVTARPRTWCRCATAELPAGDAGRGRRRRSPCSASARSPSPGRTTRRPWPSCPSRTRCWPPRTPSTYEVNFDDGSKATVVRSESKGKAVLVTDDMAAPPTGKVFELWLQDETGRHGPRPA